MVLANICFIFSQCKTDIDVADNYIDEGNKELRTAILVKNMEKIQGAQSKIDMAIASRKRATQNLIGLEAKKKEKLTSQLIVFLKSCNFVEEDIDIKMLHGSSFSDFPINLTRFLVF